ncbi:tetratricopeptide repeat protein [Aureivirga sp. CE67]|uniref:tetratricopeptide repeat protein n=1 Tax=Aureivirga sp. CE67 TaxID=1788983 RepID=UPI0018CB3A72|nr:tetratricopeptide repeat protein [Aureivirga sp. CE67]
MKKIIITICVLMFSVSIFAQNSMDKKLEELYLEEKYDELIKNYASKDEDYSGEAYYYIGKAYYMKSDDTNCIKYMDLSIEKNPMAADAFYFKGKSFQYLDQYEKSLEFLKKAEELNNTISVYQSSIGDSYYNLKKYDEAIEYYKKATKHEKVDKRPFSMLGQIYSEKNKNEEALKYYYLAKEKDQTKAEEYANTVFNIGLLELLSKNYDKAEKAFAEVLELVPNDYHAVAKMIQVYYAKKQYEKAEPFREILYDAKKKNLLPEFMSDKFCFYQFDWKEYLVQVFERYENRSSGGIYYKHIFYVVNKSGDIEFTVQTEFSPVAMELENIKYLLCSQKGSIHGNSGIGFNDGFDFDDLKSAAIKYMENLTK